MKEGEKKGRGRPKTSKHPNPYLVAHVSVEFNDMFSELAQEMGLSKSTLLRGLAKWVLVQKGKIAADTKYRNTPNLDLFEL